MGQKLCGGVGSGDRESGLEAIPSNLDVLHALQANWGCEQTASGSDPFFLQQ